MLDDTLNSDVTQLQQAHDFVPFSGVAVEP
jgi:hypothetical protein